MVGRSSVLASVGSEDTAAGNGLGTTPAEALLIILILYSSADIRHGMTHFILSKAHVQ